MRKTFKILLFPIVLFILTCGLVACANNNSKTVVDGLVLELINDDSGYSVVDYEGTNTVVVIPKEHNGIQIISIGAGAFDECASLESITIPDGVESIGGSTFYKCASLTTITIPDSVTSIGGQAFSGTAYYNDESNWEDGVLYIGNHLIESKVTITGSYVIKSGTKSIADGAFFNCTLLTSITMPDSITRIGSNTFSGCILLDGVTIPNSVNSIERCAFEDCDSMSSITIPNGVTNIGKHAFSDCESLASINVEIDNINYKSIDGNLYSKDGKTLIQYAMGKGLTSFIIPDGTTRVESKAFYGCDSLSSITIPDSMESVGQGAFQFCYDLNKVYYLGTINQWVEIDFEYSSSNPLQQTAGLYINGAIVEDVVLTTATKISSNAFYGYDALISVSISDNVTSIGSSAFRNCKSLASIAIPDSVTSIGYSAFENCTNLKTIYCEAISKPEGWHKNWKDDKVSVVWGYKE